MRLRSIRIQNFRSFLDDIVHFDDYTCLVGANGAGKSAILTALNVFFRDSDSCVTDVTNLGEEDFHHRRTDNPVRITLTFDQLTPEAKNDFKHYVRQGRLTVFAKAEWDASLKRAPVRQYGARLVMRKFAPFFEALNNGAKVDELRNNYAAIRLEIDGLPQVATKNAMEGALREYEESHTDQCELLDDPEQFYGWSQGKNLLRKHLQWVYVPAVKDASAEQNESARSALRQLLDRTIRSLIRFDEPLSALKTELEEKYREILGSEAHVLTGLSESLAARLQTWGHPSARLELDWHYDENKSLQINQPIARARLGEDSFLGDVARLGHGMQRCFLVSLLHELASTSHADAPVLLLGFEEPELYQHPPQAQHVARTLEELAITPAHKTQVIISTHSPHFVSSKWFENVRMVRKHRVDNCSRIAQAKYSDISRALAQALGQQTPFLPSAVMAAVDQIMQPSQKELFFARVAVLVEGTEDVGYIATHLQLTGRWNEFRRLGCHFIVCEGKTSMSRPLAIAAALCIPSFAIFDGDMSKSSTSKEAANNDRDNLCLLRLCRHDMPIAPQDEVSENNCHMWKETIEYAVRHDIGEEAWTTALNDAREKYRLSATNKKNSVLISATLELLHENHKASKSLDRVCGGILDYAANVVDTEDMSNASGYQNRSEIRL